MILLYRIIQAIVLSQISLVNGQTTPAYVNTTGCITGPSSFYVGTQNVTFSGIPCQRWDATEPHEPIFAPHDGTQHNYCRNPDNDASGTWCYTTDPEIRWQYCRIPKCPDFSLLLITSRTSEGAQLLHTPADIEANYPNVQILPVFNKSKGLFGSVAADKHGQRVFYSDTRSDNLGIYSFDTNTTTTKMSGMMKYVEQVAHDWVTQNIYFNDYKKKWIMAVEKNFQYYTIVYRNISESFYGLALHAKRRLLFFTITDAAGFTYIKSADVAGRNVSVIYPKQQSPPTIIRSLAIDYTDDRLYWGVETFDSSLICSSRLDGSNLTQIRASAVRNIMGVAAYLNYIYLIEDSQQVYYSLRIFTKEGTAFTRLVSEIPFKGLAVYSDREEYSLDDSGLNETISIEGECARQPPCDHICLPRLNARRECRCLPGYYKEGDTRCTTRFLTDNYMVVVDKAQKRIFQLSLSDADHNYTAVETNNSDVSALAMNPLTGALLLYDSNSTAIYKTDRNGDDLTQIVNNIHVKSMAIDPLTGNIYYADADSETINVIDANGHFMKALTSPPTNTSGAWKLETVSLDIVNKHLYWTTTKEDTQQTELRRMGMDGSNQSLLLRNMRSIKQILISNERRSIFISVLRETGSNWISILHEIPLSSLQLSDDIPDDSTQYRIHFIDSSLIVDQFVISGSLLYFNTKPPNGVQSIDLTDSGGFSVFGSVVEEKNFIFIPRYLSVFEETQRTTISSLQNPCRNTLCGELCLITPQNTSICACRNGFNVTGNSCRSSSESIATTIRGTHTPIKTTIGGTTTPIGTATSNSTATAATMATITSSSRSRFTISATSSMTTSPTTTSRDITVVVGSADVKPASDQGQYLSTGATVAIIVMALVVLFIFSGIVYIRRKKKSSGFGAQDGGALTFLWRKTPEKGQANECVYRNF